MSKECGIKAHFEYDSLQNYLDTLVYLINFQSRVSRKLEASYIKISFYVLLIFARKVTSNYS